MLTHDQQTNVETVDNSQNPYEQYIHNYAAQQVMYSAAAGIQNLDEKTLRVKILSQAYAQQAYALYVASFSGNRTYVPR